MHAAFSWLYTAKRKNPPNSSQPTWSSYLEKVGEEEVNFPMTQWTLRMARWIWWGATELTMFNEANPKLTIRSESVE